MISFVRLKAVADAPGPAASSTSSGPISTRNICSSRRHRFVMYGSPNFSSSTSPSMKDSLPDTVPARKLFAEAAK